MKDKDILEMKRPIVEACIKSAQKSGWSDAMGVIRGTLFLENKPMSLDDLAERTGYSKTTLRTNLNYLENIGVVQRVVDPMERQHQKLYRYALVTDAEAVKLSFFASKKEEANLILQALLQIQKNLKENNVEDAGFETSLSEAIQFYKVGCRVLDLLGHFSLNELIEILESNRNKDSRE